MILQKRNGVYDAEFKLWGFKQNKIQGVFIMGNKDLEAMEDKELLIELVKSQRKDALGQRITAIATLGMFAALVIALVIIVPKVVATIDQVQTTITETENLVKQAEETMSGIDSMVANVDSLVVENTESVNKAMEDLNNIDFETLNQGIQDLSDVVEPLANFFNKFK